VRPFFDWLGPAIQMPERVVAGIGCAFRVTDSEIIRSAMQSHTVIRVIWLRQFFLGSLNFPVALGYLQSGC